MFKRALSLLQWSVQTIHATQIELATTQAANRSLIRNNLLFSDKIMELETQMKAPLTVTPTQTQQLKLKDTEIQKSKLIENQLQKSGDMAQIERNTTEADNESLRRNNVQLQCKN